MNLKPFLDERGLFGRHAFAKQEIIALHDMSSDLRVAIV